MSESAFPDFDRMWDFDRPAETERKFVELMESVGDAAPAGYRAELKTQIARAQGLQRKFDQGHRTLDELRDGNALAISPRARVRYLLERGRLFNSDQKVAEAAPPFREAVNVATEAKEEFLAIDAAHMLGICLKGEEAIAWNEKAIAMAEGATDANARGWAGSLLNNLGWTYHDQGKYARALDLFERALAFRQARKQDRQIRIAQWAVARTLRSLGHVTEALAMQEALRAANEAAGDSDGFVQEEIGECLLLLGRGEEARDYFGEAYALLSKDLNLAASEPERLERLKTLGQ